MVVSVDIVAGPAHGFEPELPIALFLFLSHVLFVLDVVLDVLVLVCEEHQVH